MAHFDHLFTEYSQEGMQVLLRAFREQHPGCAYCVKNGDLKEWGYYLFESHLNDFEAFVTDKDRINKALQDQKFLIGVAVGKRNLIRDRTIVVNYHGKNEIISAKNIERAKEIIDSLVSENENLMNAVLSQPAMPPKPRVRVRANVIRNP